MPIKINRGFGAIRSIFSVGGATFGGAVFILSFFSRELVDSRTPRSFMPLVNYIKSFMMARCSMSRVFRRENAVATRADADAVAASAGA
ncbi:MAG: hypothetical protein IT350_12600 [Deltaproteobacteria bacterium]|nr:hypothetical protein [Deltaproteobacteria bacterium]